MGGNGDRYRARGRNRQGWAAAGGQERTMTTMRKPVLILATAVLALLGASCTKLKSRDQLNKGIESFRNAQYPDAVEHFKTAVQLDPSYATARMYLATSYMQQYIPGRSE